ncbi:MAG: hypothetical protein ACRC6E_01460 [Fusobacteriaceae bacterium]
MKTIKMDFNNETRTCDFHINSDGFMEIIENNEYLAQALKDEMESNIKQWYLGYNWGVKLLQDDKTGILDKKKITTTDIESELRRVVSKYKDIVSSKVKVVDTTDRVCHIEIEIVTKYGDLPLEISLGGVTNGINK